ncbi:MAG: NUDIX domain-containing protein [Gammaproteobacteria bacterium]|nr:NUDIX domain-containing protein [Gammaproteobacteria bacterium]
MALPDKWEFPGGKVEDAEPPEAALAREIMEELGVRVQIGELLGRGFSNSGDRTVVLDVYAKWLDGMIYRENTPRWPGHRLASFRATTGQKLTYLSSPQCNVC